MQSLIRIARPILAVGLVISVAALIWIGARVGQSPADISPGNFSSVKIIISEDGLYRIGLRVLQRAGLNIENWDEPFRLSAGDLTIPYLLDDDELVFWGTGPRNRYSTYRAYLLEAGVPGSLMKSASVAPVQGPDQFYTERTLHLEEDNIYDSRGGIAQGEEIDTFEPWYWTTIQVEGQFETLIELESEVVEPGILRLGLWGATSQSQVENDHDLDVYINDHYISTIRWDGESYHIAELVLPGNTLARGRNRILLDNSKAGAVPIDIMRLDWIELLYMKDLRPEGGIVQISGVQGTSSIPSFDENALVLDITSGDNPFVATGWINEDGNIVLEIKGGQKLIVVGNGGYLTPETIRPVRESILENRDNQADLIILTTAELLDPIQPLVDERNEQGVRTVVATVEDVYDHFGFGQKGPESIRNFIKYASTNWTPPYPRYLLLVGDATYDYRGHLGQTIQNEIPAPMVPVDFSGETTSDARLVDIDDDGMADMAVGRWPVRSRQQVSNLVERTIFYESGRASENALFVADGTGNEFDKFNRQVIEDSGMSGKVNYLFGPTAIEMAQHWNEGAWLVSYIGHGSLNRWGKDGVFTSESVPMLSTDQSPPLVFQFTCLTGYFAHPSITSLSETMLLYDQGPVLIIAPSSLTVSSTQLPFATALLSQIMNKENTRIGDVFLQSKSSLAIQEDDRVRQVSDTFGLIGDPSALIVRPED